MKLRLGFVSNSSSSSFVLLKSNMTDQEIDLFRSWVEKEHNKSSEGYIYETRSTFSGDKNYHIDLPDSIKSLTDKFEYE